VGGVILSLFVNYEIAKNLFFLIYSIFYIIELM